VLNGRLVKADFSGTSILIATALQNRHKEGFTSRPHSLSPIQGNVARHSIARKYFSSGGAGSQDDRTLIAPTSHFDFLDQNHFGAQI
jgi:hypothetical protein